MLNWVLRKLFGLVVPLSVLTVGCMTDSAESRQREAVHQLDKVLTLRQKNTQLSAPWISTDPQRIPQDILRQLKSYDEQMLKESQTIDADALNQVYPRLGTMFSQTFAKSLVLHVEAQREYMQTRAKGQPYMAESDQKENEAQALRQQWAEWFNSGKVRKITPSEATR